MNDVLPKPFTKEGLMICLDKHLGHLKKENQVISIKGDESPNQSPATLSATWNSPAHLQGPSPVSSHMSHDDYASAMRQQGPPQYGAIDGACGAHYNHNSSAPHTPLSAGPHPLSRAQPGQGHRRQVSDMTGGDDAQGSAKRQQFHPPAYQHQTYQR